MNFRVHHIHRGFVHLQMVPGPTPGAMGRTVVQGL